MPSEDVDQHAAASRFVAALGAAMSASNYPVTMVRGVMAATSKAYVISMMSIAVGVQTGLLLWRAIIQLSDAPNRRAFHD